jgi:hypothetical protein
VRPRDALDIFFVEASRALEEHKARELELQKQLASLHEQLKKCQEDRSSAQGHQLEMQDELNRLRRLAEQPKEIKQPK